MIDIGEKEIKAIIDDRQGAKKLSIDSAISFTMNELNRYSMDELTKDFPDASRALSEFVDSVNSKYDFLEQVKPGNQSDQDKLLYLNATKDSKAKRLVDAIIKGKVNN